MPSKSLPSVAPPELEKPTEQETPTEQPKPKKKRKRTPRPLRPASEYLTRAELLALVPLSMSSIDALEKRGIFPSRFKIEPTACVAWKRREVVRFIEARAAKRVHDATL